MLTSKDLFLKLKQHYDDNRVSLLVGAGFSLNAYPDFPLWDSLMSDILSSLHLDRIKDEYLRYAHEGGAESIDDFIKRKYAALVAERGYLQLVSDYEQALGSREAVDVYIEDHVPYLHVDPSGYRLSTDPSFKFGTQNLVTHISALKCNWDGVYTTNYDNLLERAAQAANLNYQAVSHDYELGKISPNRRHIIKLHGDLASDSLSDHYEFDNDHTRRYIISKEDYDTYPARHEAFTQMMRIGMLKGVFLLVGFSGNDPNFIAWLRWMTDILNKDGNRDKSDIKVFLCLPATQKIPRHKELYCQNHGIGVIYLDDADLLAHLGLTAASSDTSSRLCGLFRKLNETPVNSAASTTADYAHLWRDLHSAYDNGSLTSSDIDRLRNFPGRRRIPKSVTNQQVILEKSVYWTDRPLSETESALLSEAIDDMGIASGLYGGDGRNKQAIIGLVAWQRQRDWISVLSNSLPENPTSLQKAMHLAFNLKFEELHSFITDEWNPQGHDALIAAGLLSLFNKKEAIERLEGYMATATDPQEKSFAGELIDLIDFHLPHRYPLSSFGDVDHIGDIIRYFDEQLRPDDDKIKPLGHSTARPPQQRGIEMCALRLIDLLINTGWRPSFGIVYTIASQRWFRAFCSIFEAFPYPALYYSLFTLDRDAARRIGQEFACSGRLAEDLPALLDTLLNFIICGSNPSLCDTACLIASEMLAAVKPTLWFGKIITILDNLLAKLTVLRPSDAPVSLMCKALSRLNDPTRQHAAFLRLLPYIADNKEVVTKLLSELPLDFNLTGADQKLIGESLSRLSSDDAIIAAAIMMDNAGNGFSGFIREWVADNLIANIDFDSLVGKWDVLHPLTYLAPAGSPSLDKVKETILRGNIWNCGVRDHSSVCSFEFLDLSRINPDLKWTASERKKIAGNLEKNLLLLENYKGLNDEIFATGYYNWLTAAVRYLSAPSDTLVPPEPAGLLTRAQSLLYTLLGHDDFYSALSSDNPRAATYFTDTLIHALINDGLTPHIDKLKFLLDRVIFTQKGALHHIILSIEHLARNYPDILLDNEILPKVLLILDIYRSRSIAEMNLPVTITCRCMNNIARAVSTHAPDNQAVAHWLTSPSITRFL